MKYTILLALVASTQAMPTVPIASLIELNEEPRPLDDITRIEGKAYENQLCNGVNSH